MTQHLPGQPFPARWWHVGADDRLVCDVCPKACALADGEAGSCAVRVREGDRMVLTTYGRGAGFCVDAIERRPLCHFLPGTPVMCLGTAGCNLSCRSCRVWRPETVAQVSGLLEDASPRAAAGLATEWRCSSIAFTYNDPVVYAEYAIAVARAAHVAGLRTIAVTAGFLSPVVRRDFFGVMDAAVIELKVFDEEAHQRYAGGSLLTVLDTLSHVAHRHDTWLEISTVLLPGLNDDPLQLRAMCTWIRAELGRDVPLHFSAPVALRRPAASSAGPSGGASGSAGLPDPAGSAGSPSGPSGVRPASPGWVDVARAREIAMDAGLRYVYTDDLAVPGGRTTRCPSCGAVLIERGLTIRRYRLTSEGRCPECRTAVPGHFGDRAGEARGQRIPVRVP